MARTSLIVSLSSIALATLAGTANAIQFQRSVGFTSQEVAYCIENLPPSSAGGFVTVGRTAPATTAFGDIYVNRFDKLGNEVWARVIGSVNQQNESGFSVRETLDKGFIVGAETNSVAANMGIALTRLDNIGNTMWSFVYAGTPGLDSPSGVKVRDLPDGTFAAIGRMTLVSGGPMNGILLRVDPAGIPIVERIYSLIGTNGNVSFTDLREIRTAAGGVSGFIISGWTQDTPNALRQALLMQTDLMGNPVWVRSYLTPNASITADGLFLPPGNNAFFSGRIFTATGAPTSTVVAGVDTGTGAVAWSRRIDDFRNGFAAVANDNDRFALVGGTSISRASAGIYKFDPAGNFITAMMYGQPNQPGEGQDVVALHCNRGYALTGQTAMLPSNGPTDLHLVRTNVNAQSGCRENPLPPPAQFPITIIQRQLAATFRQEFAPWQTFNQRRISGNIPYCLNDCVADVDDGTGTGTPDGGVGIEDLLFYLGLYDAGSVCADLDDGTGTGTPDGGVGIEDLLYYLTRYDLGC